jgi:RNA recognition motif-containing protein
MITELECIRQDANVAAPPKVVNSDPNDNKAIRTIWLGSLPPHLNAEDISQVFSRLTSQHYEVTLNRTNNSISGDITAFVCFHDRKSAEQTMDLISSGTIKIRNKVLTCAWAKKNTKTVGHYRNPNKLKKPKRKRFTPEPKKSMHVPILGTAPEEPSGETTFRSLFLNQLPFLTMGPCLFESYKKGGFSVDSATMEDANSALVCFHTVIEAAAALLASKSGKIIVNGKSDYSVEWASNNSRKFS